MRRNRCFEVMLCFFCFAGLDDCVGRHACYLFFSFFLVLMVLVGVWGTIHCFLILSLFCHAGLVGCVRRGAYSVFCLFFFC